MSTRPSRTPLGPRGAAGSRGKWPTASEGAQPQGGSASRRAHPAHTVLETREARHRGGVGRGAGAARRAGRSEAHAPLFEWETLEREKWSPEDVARAGFRRHRPRRRAREEVQVTMEAEAAARAAATHITLERTDLAFTAAPPPAQPPSGTTEAHAPSTREIAASTEVQKPPSKQSPLAQPH
jgi:hypothetical protein